MKNNYLVKVELDIPRTGYAEKYITQTTKTYEVNAYKIENGVLELHPLDKDGKLKEKIFIPLYRIYNINVTRLDGNVV